MIIASDSTVRFFSLNVRGLRNDKKRRNVFKYLKDSKYDCVCLQETHVGKDLLNRWKKEWGGVIVCSEYTERSCGQMILFKPKNDVETEILYDSKRILAVKFKYNLCTFVVVNVYASNIDVEKRQLFYDLTNLVSNWNNLYDNVCVCGDFNTVLDNNLDIVSGEKHSPNVVLAFNDFFNICNLIDSFRIFNDNNKEYTWSKSIPFIARRLDYILLSENLFEKATEANIHSVPFSDHRGCLLVIKTSSIEKGPGTWKFNNSLLKDIIFVEKMNDLIDRYCVKLTDDGDRQIEWELLKLEIKQYTMNYSKLIAINKRDKIKSLYTELDSIESLLSKDPQNDRLIKKRDLLKINLEVIQSEKTTAAQVRSRVRYIEEGEKNTKYFLNLERANYNSKIMESLIDEKGKEYTEQKDILNFQKEHYKELYRKKLTQMR